ncbi:unnamed protein product [Aspergillus oryzae]|nr:unnamed protein product [Aspergillus oryzae]GMF93636.1 unnamed protein product [Aspergillus oryzae]
MAKSQNYRPAIIEMTVSNMSFPRPSRRKSLTREHSVGDELAIDSEYGSKNTYNQTQKVVEDGNGLGNDPCDHPQGERNANPGSNSKNALLVHVVRATENANIDVFAGNVAVDNTSNDDL